MVLLYSSSITARINYISHFLFKEMMGIEFSFTANKEEFLIFTGYKFNYSGKDLGNIPSIVPVSLLFEEDIKGQEISCFNYEGIKAFFKCNSENAFPFDIFAASFYLLSRYEEYLSFNPDKHERFPAEQSIAYQNQFLNIPVIEFWLEKLKNYLVLFYPDLKFRDKKFKFISTIDVDNGYAYKGKTVFKTISGLIKSFLKGDFSLIIERIKVLSGLMNDPFDHYDYQKQLKDNYGSDLIYFMLCGDQGPNDHNILSQSREFKNLARNLSSFAEVGLHPSYASDSKKETIIKEKKSLENIISKSVNKSRQHFLRMKLPDTYRALISAGIIEDYSMGYASEPGFRAGISGPFRWFDLSVNEETDLTVYPFSVMEVTFQNYQKQNAGEALITIKEIIKSVKEVNGFFISVWHDRTFADYPQNKGWNETYVEMVKEATGNFYQPNQ